jgi:hypothetical protein
MENPSLQIGDNNWAVKDGSILGYNIIQDNYLPQPIDFTRASTATRVNAAGLIESVATGVPRIDYTTGSPALLLEPQRTNLIKNSANVGAGFVTINITLVLNNAAAPNGLVEADKFYPTTSGNNRWFYQAVTTSASSTISLFAKADGKDIVYISAGSATDVSFDLSSGLVTYESSGWVGSIEDFGDGWYRCIAVRSSSLSFAAYGVADSSGGSFVTASGTDGILVWGMQCEQGSYPTSYIPTSGTAVTRVKDFGNTDVFGSTFTLSSDFVLFSDIKLKDIAANVLWSSGDYSIGADYRSYCIFSSTTRFILFGVGEVVVADLLAVTFVADTHYKIAIRRESGVVNFFVNGTKYSSSGGTPSTTVKIRSISGANLGGKNIYDLNSAFINENTMSDAELLTLTTI